MRASLRSFAVGLVGLGAVAVVRTLVVLGPAGASESPLISDVGGGIIASAAAVLVLVFASLLRDPGARRHWLFLGVASLCFAAADVLWAIAQAGTGEVPYPGMPDVFYLTGYIFLSVALFSAAYDMRHGADARSAALVSGLSCVVGLGALYLGLVGPLLLPAGLGAVELGLTVLYLLVDVILVLTPGVFLLIIAFRSGDRRVTMPWGTASVGLAFIVISDISFAWLTASGNYAGGALVDYGWMLARVSIAVAASFALDAEVAAVPVWQAHPNDPEAARRSSARTSTESAPRLDTAASTRRGA